MHLPEILFILVYRNYSNQLYTALEVYQNANGKTTVIQQRSHVIKGFGIEFAKRYSEWIKSVGFSRVVVVTGLDQSRRSDAQLTGLQCRIHLVGTQKNTEGIIIIILFKFFD